MLLEMDIVARQLPVPIAPTAPTTPEAIAPIVTIAPKAIAPTASTILKKQLSPDRPEVLIQAYLAEKTAWLA